LRHHVRSIKQIKCGLSRPKGLDVVVVHKVVVLYGGILSDLTAPALFGDTITFKVPCVVHHEFEVVVSVDAHADVVVVLDPLGLRDVTVAGVLDVVRVVQLEGVQEFEEDLVLGFLSRLDVGVQLSVVFLLDVFQVDGAGIIGIHDGKGLHCKILSELVHLSTDAAEEFFVIDVAVSAAIEYHEQAVGVLLVEADAEVVNGLLELFDVKVLTVIIVSDFKLTAESLDTAGTTGSELLAHDFAELLVRVVHVLGLGGGLGGGTSLLALATSGGGGGGAAGVAPAGLFDAGAVKVPCGVHHYGEVIVAIDRGGDVVVVLVEFILGNDMVGCFVAAHVVGGLEGLKEFLENLLLSLLARDDIGVLGGRVDALDVIVVKVAVAVLVHDGEGLGNDSPAGGVHGSADGTEEFVVLEEAVFVGVKVVEDSLDFTLGEAEAEVAHTLAELVLVEGH